MNYLYLEPFKSGKVEADAKPKALIKSEECDAVLLSVWNVNDDNEDTAKNTVNGFYEEAQEEIFWGTNNVCVHQLFPAQQTILIPVSNANQIFVRSNLNKSDSVMVGYTLFKIRSK